MRLAFCVCIANLLAAGLPAVVFADDAPVTAESLAAVQSLVDRCGQLNPDAAARFKEFSAQAVKDTPQPEVDRLRASAAYKTAYTHATDQLAAQPASDVETVCKTLLKGTASQQGSESKADAPAPDAASTPRN